MEVVEMKNKDAVASHQSEHQSKLERLLISKSQFGDNSGFSPLWIPDWLFPFQQSLTEWSIVRGRGAELADCGLGKTIMQLVWAENVVRKTNRPVLILCPLAVAQQTIAEGAKFGIEVRRSNDGKIQPGINITNYEKLHHFNPADVVGLVCDESSCIKNFNGKRREQVTEFLRTLQYRLLCTATAAPNDYTELGTSSEALGELGQMDMLGRFFVNDQNTCDPRKLQRRAISQGGPVSRGWRFKGHAELAVFRWVVCWARAGRKPSDFGPFSDDKFQLLPLQEIEHIAETRTLAPGMLFPLPASNLAEEREERRRTIGERCELAASLVNHTGKPAVIWGHLNDECDLLEKLIPDGAQVSGADSDEAKERTYQAFADGSLRVLIIKPKIGAWGLNWQHCAHVVTFASHSYEQYYQAVRRCHRFGQKLPVKIDIIATEGEKGALENMMRKSQQADRMFAMLVEEMNAAINIDVGQKFTEETQVPSWL
jgi:hypothetical protein